MVILWSHRAIVAQWNIWTESDEKSGRKCFRLTCIMPLHCHVSSAGVLIRINILTLQRKGTRIRVRFVWVGGNLGQTPPKSWSICSIELEIAFKEQLIHLRKNVINAWESCSLHLLLIDQLGQNNEVAWFCSTYIARWYRCPSSLPCEPIYRRSVQMPGT